jgi:hypothetical protein
MPPRARALPAALILLACAGALVFPGPARAAQSVPLPTEADLVSFAPGAETILYGRKGIETLLPGPVDDDEVVTVAFTPDGTPVEVGVRQRLVVHGLGDFRFKVAGPAQTVEPLPDSESEPGLRKGAVLWQGFSSGEKVLSSEVVLFADQEAVRLPLRASIEHTIGGEVPEGPASGPLSVRISIANQTANPVTITSATGDPDELARALDAMARRLEAGERPRPGSDGVPAALTSRAGERAITRDVPASFRVSGRLSFETGDLDGASARNGRVDEGSGSPVVHFAGYVGSGAASTFDVSVRGMARDLGRPVLAITARPAPPPADVARPPGGGTWTERAAAGELDATRPLWNRIMSLAWQFARIRQFDTYLGNPDPTGPASTVYRLRLAQPAPPPGPAVIPPPAPTAPPLLSITATLALLLLLFDGLLLWSIL